MPKINIKKYSRSNISEPDIDSNIKKSRGRPKKTNIEPETDNNIIYKIPQQEQEQETIPETIPEPIENDEIDTPDLELNEPFLEELNVNNYIEPPSENERKEIEKQQKQYEKQIEKQLKEHSKHKEKQFKIQEKVNSIYENNDLFDDKGSEIIGRDRRVIINKLNQYRSLFPNELSKFKVKKGATTQELNAYLDEMATIVETSSYDNFLTDSILQAIKMVENGSKYTKYDISGSAEMLKANPQFNSLMKQLFVKYNVFHKIPCEFQLLLLVTTTAYICSSKNKNKAHLEAYLQEPVNRP
jgi:predicted ribosome quality control (RQC) complex YloA/Tae2 family protein